jgi:hypothetical protein
MSRRWQLAALAIAVAPLLRCSDATDPNVLPCTGAVALTATSTGTPSFAWTPNCLVDQVAVEENIAPSAGGPQPRWAIQSRVTGRGTRSPLGYGQVPLSMEELLSAAALVTGHQYSVRVYANTTQVGVATFRP